VNRIRKSKSLRVRFAWGFGFMFTFLFGIAFIIIYFSYARFSKEDYFVQLQVRGISTYKLLIDEDRIDSSLIKLIDRSVPTSIAPIQRVTVFRDTNLIYSNADSGYFNYNKILFDEIKKKGEVFTLFGKDQVYGLYKEDDGDKYIVIASGDNAFGKRRLEFLRWLMVIVYFTGLLIGWASIYFFVKRSIRPLEVLNDNMKSIGYNNLDSRLPLTGQWSEIDNLSVNFNDMLVRLGQSFRFQKDFVHYASHELRTPLAAMISLTESTLSQPLSEQQFQKVLQHLLAQQQGLTNITNSLLLLSETTDKFKIRGYPLIRLDELVFHSVEISKDLFASAVIKVNLEGNVPHEGALLIHANEPLIIAAFNNLLKNAIQYSRDNTVNVFIIINEDSKIVRFENSGIDFTEAEKDKLFTPFYRASNSEQIKGHGLGLSLVKQIVQLHGASIVYKYENEKNIFSITFPLMYK